MQSYQNTLAAPRTSDKYVVLNTEELLNPLLDDGWHIHQLRETHKRNEQEQRFAAHTVTLRNDGLDAFPDPKGTGIMPEVVIMNGHEGLMSLKILAGWFRFVCSNGMIVGTSVNNTRVVHKNVTQEDVQREVIRIVEDFPRTAERIGDWSDLQLSPDMIHQFGRQAAEVRWGKDDDKINDYACDVTGIVRRADDFGNDLWTVFNRSQEQLLRGFASSKGKRSVRAINSMAKQSQVNIDLWNLADELYSTCRN